MAINDVADRRGKGVWDIFREFMGHNFRPVFVH